MRRSRSYDLMQKQLYIIGGPNGAGKTTSAFVIAPEFLKVNEFVNADEIAKGLSPFNVQSVAFQAGRIMLKRIDELITANQSFAIETTCAGGSHFRLIDRCKKLGYEVTLLFMWLPSEELAISRVAERVKQGGHDIPTDDIRRRYKRGLKNLVERYIPLCDRVVVYDMSIDLPGDSLQPIIAEKQKNGILNIVDKNNWRFINEKSKEQAK